MDRYKRGLAEYVAALAKSSIETNTAGDQTRYQFHLAQAALMFLAIEKDDSVEKLKQIIGMVKQVYRLNPLPGPAGKAATDAFMVFMNLVESG